MGVTISCKKTGRSIDMGYGGLFRLRRKVSELAGKEWSEHYDTLRYLLVGFDSAEDVEKYKNFDERTGQLIEEKKVNPKIVDFCLQSDVEGSIRYGACKVMLECIGDYDDNICYGYAGRKDCAMFRDFKAILQDCVDTKSDMIWR